MIEDRTPAARTDEPASKPLTGVWKVDGVLVSQSNSYDAALFDKQIASEQPDNVDLIMYLLFQRWQEAHDNQLN
jgi:hypothetical protein